MIASHLGSPLEPAAPTAPVPAQTLPASTPISRIPPIPPRPTRSRRRPSQSYPPTVAAACSDFYPAPAPVPGTFPAPIPSPIFTPTPHSIPPPPAPSSYLLPTSAPTERPTASCTRCHNKNNPQPCLPGKMTCVGCSFRRKSLRQQREEEGLCTTCGRDRGNDGKLTCGECRAKGRVRYAKGKGKGQ